MVLLIINARLEIEKLNGLSSFRRVDREVHQREEDNSIKIPDCYNEPPALLQADDSIAKFGPTNQRSWYNQKWLALL